MLQRLAFVFLFCMLLVSALAQTRIQNQLYLITDTTSTEETQARDLYFWLISNFSIELDDGLIIGGDLDVKHLISSQKLTVFEISWLYHQMCFALNLESYLIKGYCKDITYVDKTGFVKANHYWNVLLLNNTWYLADVSLGCGNFGYVSDARTMFRRKLFNKSGINTKLQFTHKPNEMWFNVAPKLILDTHFPIDSKWQLLETPKAYKTFVFGTDTVLPSQNFEYEIIKIRNKTADYQFIQDAENAMNINPENTFDLAQACYQFARKRTYNEYQVFDSVLFEQLVENKSLFEKADTLSNQSKRIAKRKYQNQHTTARINYKLGITAYNLLLRSSNSINIGAASISKKLISAEKRLNNPKSLINELLLHLPEIDTLENESETFSDFKEVKAVLVIFEQNMAILEKLSAMFEQQAKEIDKQLPNLSSKLDDINRSINAVDEYGSYEFCRNLNEQFPQYDLQLQVFNQRNADFLTQLFVTIQDFQQLNGVLQQRVNFKKYDKLTAEELIKLKPFILDLKQDKDSLQMLLNKYRNNWESIASVNATFQSSYGKESQFADRLHLFYEFTANRAEQAYQSHIKQCDYIIQQSRIQLKYIQGLMKNFVKSK